MKKLLLSLVVGLISAQALATGGIYCKSTDGKFEFSATTGRVTGAPIVNFSVTHMGKILAEDKQGSSGIVQYSSTDLGMILTIVDSNAMPLVEMRTAMLTQSIRNSNGEIEDYQQKEAGVALVHLFDVEGKEKLGSLYLIECESE